MISETAHTARFVCTTDDEHVPDRVVLRRARCPRPGRSSWPRSPRGVGGLDLVVHRAGRPGRRCCGTPRSAGSAATRSRPTRPSRWRGWAATDIATLVDGATYLFTNDYEKALLEQKTGWTDAEVLERVSIRVTTLGRGRGPDRSPGAAPLQVPVVPERAGRRPDRRRRRVPLRVPRRDARGAWPGAVRAGRALLATLVLETVGTQEYAVEPAEFTARLGEVVRRRGRRRGRRPPARLSPPAARRRVRRARPRCAGRRRPSRRRGCSERDRVDRARGSPG